jgi:hypothetical protein
MATWHEAIREFKAESQSHDGETATIVLMYLVLKREDYPYHMASIFKEELKEKNGWSKEKLDYLRSLKDKNQLTILLTKMQEAGFLESTKEQGGRSKRIYNIKIEVMSSPYAEAGYKNLYYFLPNKGKTPKNEAIDQDIVKAFLPKLKIPEFHDYFVTWSGIDKFDFITFLGLLKNEAERMSDSNMKELMIRNIYETKRIEKAIFSLKSHFEIVGKMESENRKRKIYREPSIYEKI